MLDALSERLQGTFKRLGSHGKITEADLDVALREVRAATPEELEEERGEGGTPARALGHDCPSRKSSS